jgi:quercetin dioxygenase-like cupin family protein
MSYNILSRLAKFEELIPSKIPFVEGKLKGHQDRKNYSVIGPGVSEDTKQNVKIAEAHGFNIGAVSAAPRNGSGLHSHTTAEVFLIHLGSWRFYWGTEGKEGEIILHRGDVASFPTNMFRGFQNVSDEEALMFVVLGENNPGVITWTPKLLKDAKESGMLLMDDNSLIDLDKQNVPEGKKAIEPLQKKDLQTFDHYTSEEIEKFVIRYNDSQKYIVDDDHYKSNLIINYLDTFEIHGKVFEPHISHKTGFSLSLLKGNKAHIHEYSLNQSEAYNCLEGEWEVTCNGEKLVIGPKDTFSAPKNSIRSLRHIGQDEGSLFIVRHA